MFGLDLSDFVVGVICLVVAWWFLPQPRWLRKLYKQWNIAYLKDQIF